MRRNLKVKLAQTQALNQNTDLNQELGVPQTIVASRSKSKIRTQTKLNSLAVTNVEVPQTYHIHFPPSAAQMNNQTINLSITNNIQGVLAKKSKIQTQDKPKQVYQELVIKALGTRSVSPPRRSNHFEKERNLIYGDKGNHKKEQSDNQFGPWPEKNTESYQKQSRFKRKTKKCNLIVQGKIPVDMPIFQNTQLLKQLASFSSQSPQKDKYLEENKSQEMQSVVPSQDKLFRNTTSWQQLIKSQSTKDIETSKHIDQREEQQKDHKLDESLSLFKKKPVSSFQAGKLYNQFNHLDYNVSDRLARAASDLNLLKVIPRKKKGFMLKKNQPVSRNNIDIDATLEKFLNFNTCHQVQPIISLNGNLSKTKLNTKSPLTNSKCQLHTINEPKKTDKEVLAGIKPEFQKEILFSKVPAYAMSSVSKRVPVFQIKSQIKPQDENNQRLTPNQIQKFMMETSRSDDNICNQIDTLNAVMTNNPTPPEPIAKHKIKRVQSGKTLPKVKNMTDLQRTRSVESLKKQLKQEQLKIYQSAGNISLNRRISDRPLKISRVKLNQGESLNNSMKRVYKREKTYQLNKITLPKNIKKNKINMNI